MRNLTDFAILQEYERIKRLGDMLVEILADRISFRVFLGTTEVVPDSTTIWKFRERLAETGADKEVWLEMQKQLDAMNIMPKQILLVAMKLRRGILLGIEGCTAAKTEEK